MRQLMIEEIKIPDIGENVEAGEVVNVLVKEGDMVEVDDILIEFETDKAMVEIPSTAKGIIVEVLIKPGDELKVGDVIAKVDTQAQAAPEEAASKADATEEKSEETAVEASADPDIGAVPEVSIQAEHSLQTDEAEVPLPVVKEAKQVAPEDAPIQTRAPETPLTTETEHGPAHGAIPASPSVRRLARELGVDLRAVQGTAPGGRISETDIQYFVKQGQPTAARTPATDTAAATALPDFSRWGDIESIDLSKVRRLTVESTSRSWQQVPHVTQFDQADITRVEAFIQQNAGRVQKAGGKLTITAILTKVCAEALQKFTQFNASLDLANQKLILKKYVHIGIMVDTSRGLLVPVVRDANLKSISQIAVDIAGLAHRARNKKITPDEMQGGSFSISNQGGIGGTAFTPIVLWPQAAILGVSRTTTKPLFIEAGFKPRSVLPLSLSYDHRIIDGADAARFLSWICDSLQQPFHLFLD
jgi:pyruvate dehydrogenase E2 component (dihydrolipoamide acetyltransferase)